MNTEDFVTRGLRSFNRDLQKISSIEFEPAELYAMGVMLIYIACAKDGETLLESITQFRRVIQIDEAPLRTSWDLFKQWSPK